MTPLLALVPGCPGLRIDDLILTPNLAVALIASTAPAADCPRCGTPSRHLHSHYRRTAADLPCQERMVALRLVVRRFRCPQSDCPQTIFCERLSGLLPAHARSTERLSSAHRTIGLALGGEAGSRLAEHLDMPTSPDTLLRRVKDTPDEVEPLLRYVGVDDWAIRKGQRYGTILIDLERGRVIDLLPGRDGAALKDWLKEHPSVEVITRDRWAAYAQAATEAAPQAKQVADRWHLLKNLREAIERLLARMSSDVREALHETPSPTESGSPEPAVSQATFPPAVVAPAVAQPPLAVPESKPLSPRQQAREGKRQQRSQQYERVRALHAEGLSLRKIARTVGVSVKRVRHYLRVERCPDWNVGRPRPTQLDGFAAQVEEWITQGGRNAVDLHRKLSEQGCRVGYDAVRRFVNRRLGSRGRPGPRIGPLAPPPAAPPPSARQLSFAVLRREGERTSEQQKQVERLQAGNTVLREGLELALLFAALVRKTNQGTLSWWLARAESSKCRELQSFAASLRQDEAAVAAALSEPWSNGPVEGAVNRLKVITTDYPDRHTPSLGGYTTRAALCGAAPIGRLDRPSAGYLWRLLMSNTRDSRRPPAR
jgi:transposase